MVTLVRHHIAASVALAFLLLSPVTTQAQELRPIPPGQLVPEADVVAEPEETPPPELRLSDAHPDLQGQRSNALRTVGFFATGALTGIVTVPFCWYGPPAACATTATVAGISLAGFLTSYIATIYFSYRASRLLRAMGASIGPGLLYAGLGMFALTVVGAILPNAGANTGWTSGVGLLAFSTPFLQVIANRRAYRSLARRTEFALTPQLGQPGLQLRRALVTKQRLAENSTQHPTPAERYPPTEDILQAVTGDVRPARSRGKPRVTRGTTTHLGLVGSRVSYARWVVSLGGIPKEGKVVKNCGAADNLLPSAHNRTPSASPIQVPFRGRIRSRSERTGAERVPLRSQRIRLAHARSQHDLRHPGTPDPSALGLPQVEVDAHRRARQIVVGMP